MSEHLSLGDLIRRQREELGLTYARLAELVGRSPSTIRSWERNLSLPGDEDSLSALGAVLDLADEDIRNALGGAYPAFDTDQPSAPPASADASGSPGPTQVDPESGIDAPPEVSPENAAPPAESSSVEATEDAPQDAPAPIAATSSQDASVAENDKPGAGAVSAEAAAAPAGAPEAVDASPTVVDTPQAAASEPYATPHPSGSRSTVAARARVPSYMDDPGEARIYRMRSILTAVIIVLLFLVLMWAFGEARDALGSLFGS